MMSNYHNEIDARLRLKEIRRQSEQHQLAASQRPGLRTQVGQWLIDTGERLARHRPQPEADTVLALEITR